MFLENKSLLAWTQNVAFAENEKVVLTLFEQMTNAVVLLVGALSRASLTCWLNLNQYVEDSLESQDSTALVLFYKVLMKLKSNWVVAQAHSHVSHTMFACVGLCVWVRLQPTLVAGFLFICSVKQLDF